MVSYVNTIVILIYFDFLNGRVYIRIHIQIYIHEYTCCVAAHRVSTAPCCKPKNKSFSFVGLNMLTIAP